MIVESKKLSLFLGCNAVMLLSIVPAFGQEKAEVKNPFQSIDAQVLEIRFNGQDLVYDKRVVVGVNGKEPRVVSRPQKFTYAVMVPYTEKVDGKIITKMRKELRERTTIVTTLVDGEYKSVMTPIDKDAEFFATDGSKLTAKDVVKRVGMKRASVIVLKKNQKLSPAWKSLLKDDIVIVRSDGLIADAFRNRAK